MKDETKGYLMLAGVYLMAFALFAAALVSCDLRRDMRRVREEKLEAQCKRLGGERLPGTGDVSYCVRRDSILATEWW